LLLTSLKLSGACFCFLLLDDPRASLVLALIALVMYWHAPGDGKQVNDGVCRASDGAFDTDGILECLEQNDIRSPSKSSLSRKLW
jgi:hypothetical protein